MLQVVVMKLAAGLLWAAFVVTVVTGQPEVDFRPKKFTNLGADCGRAQQCCKYRNSAVSITTVL